MQPRTLETIHRGVDRHRELTRELTREFTIELTREFTIELTRELTLSLLERDIYLTVP